MLFENAKNTYALARDIIYHAPLGLQYKRKRISFL